MAQKVRKGSSPLDHYQQHMNHNHQSQNLLRGASPSNLYKQHYRANTNSPNNFKGGFQFKHQKSNHDSNPILVDAFSEYSSSQANMQNYNTSSTKDNTKITIINAHNYSVASTVYNVKGYTSNITANESKIKLHPDFNSVVDQSIAGQNQQHKPPLIPSLKSKIFQTAIGTSQLMPQTSQSGNGTVLLTGATGAGMTTFDEKQLMGIYGGHSRQGMVSHGHGAIGSISNLNIPTSVTRPLVTSPSALQMQHPEEFIDSQDIQSLVDFKRTEERLRHQFFQAQNPYLYIDHSVLLDYHDKENLRKRIVNSLKIIYFIDILQYR